MTLKAFSLSLLFLILSGICVDAQEYQERGIASAAPKEFVVKKARVGDIEIAYYLRGTGKPLLMLNGFMGGMAAWDPALLELLEKHFQLILFDRRGYGHSSDVKDNHVTVRQMADDAAGLVKAIGLERVNVLGWSLGARVGQQLAIYHPGSVEKLILCAPNPGGKYRVTASWKVARSLQSSSLTHEELLKILFPQTTEGKTSELAYKTRVWQAIAKGEVPNDLNANKGAVEKEEEALHLWNRSDDNYHNLSNIKSPTLLVAGKEDVIDPPENIRLIANRIPFAWTAYFDGGHAFLFQETDRFAALVTLFFE